MDVCEFIDVLFQVMEEAVLGVSSDLGPADIGMLCTFPLPAPLL